MLTLSEISKAYGGHVLFDDVTLQLNREDRIGLVGPNGAGKSTLFSIILGERIGGFRRGHEGTQRRARLSAAGKRARRR
jgi:ATPase subunit of ABC transporter with duplicated ATPase domains